MEDKGTLILGPNKKEFNVWVDELIERGRIIFNPLDFDEFINTIKTTGGK